MVWFGLVLNGMVHGHFLDVVPCRILSSWLENQLCYGQFKVIWFVLVWLSLIWFVFICMMHGYSLNLVPCKILSWLEKQQSYGQFKDI